MHQALTTTPTTPRRDHARLEAAAILALLATLLLALGGGDVYTTWRIVSVPGGFDYNQIVTVALAHGGFQTFIAFKAATLLAWIVVVRALAPSVAAMGWALALSCAFEGAFVAWNLHLLLTLFR